MPTYQYKCKNCGHELEELQNMSEPPLTHCPNCNTENLARIIGGGAGLIFKGTGFYLTDYKKDSSKGGKPKKDTKKEATGESKSEEKKPAAEDKKSSDGSNSSKKD
jgi:putative FmdB family regulatory protein